MKLSPRLLIIVLATAGILGIGYLGYWSWGLHSDFNKSQKSTVAIEEHIFSADVNVADTRITFRYPKGWQVFSSEEPLFIKVIPIGQQKYAAASYDGLKNEPYKYNEDTPIYIRVSSTSEIPFFALLRHLSGMGLDYPKKRENVKDFIRGTETLEVTGSVAPGTFFVTRFGQTIFEMYRPVDEASQKVFNEIMKSMVITNEPSQVLTVEKMSKFDFVFNDSNYNVWVMNSKSNEKIKISNDSTENKIVSWLPNLGKVVYQPLCSVWCPNYYYFDVLSGTSTLINETLATKNGMSELSVTKQGNLVFRDYGTSANTNVYISDNEWRTYSSYVDVPGDIKVSPDERMTTVMKGFEYPPEYNDIEVLNVGSKKITEVGKGKSTTWLSSNKFLYLKANKAKEKWGYSIAEYDVLKAMSKVIVKSNVSDYSVSKDNQWLNYIVFSEIDQKDRLFQIGILTGATNEIETPCDQRITSLVSGLGRTLAFQCNDRNGLSSAYLWNGTTMTLVPLASQSFAFAQ